MLMEPLDLYKARYCGPNHRSLFWDKIPFQPRHDDVIIVGHTKSGTTWLQQILHQIRTGGDDSFPNINCVTTFLPPLKSDYEGPNAFTNLDEDQVANPRVFKVHALFEMLQNIHQQARFVVPIRNPYDTEHSMMKFLWRLLFEVDQDMTAAEYEEVSAVWPMSDFADFIASWYPHRNDPNVFFIPYEDLKRDLAACIQKLAVFINGKPLTEPTLSKVLYFCSFEYMSNNEKFQPIISDTYETGQKKPAVSCVRSDGGRVAQGKALLDESVKRLIDKKWADTIWSEFGHRNYEDLYKQCSLFQQTKARSLVSIFTCTSDPVHDQDVTVKPYSQVLGRD